jgi:type I restriction enzyme R subunit
MNEAETSAELIDPNMKACSYGVIEGSKILHEYNISASKIQASGITSQKKIADYVLLYKGIKLAVVEAKSGELGVGEGVAQAKQYADKLKLETTYLTNGKGKINRLNLFKRMRCIHEKPNSILLIYDIIHKKLWTKYGLNHK